ncbi:hypothetical protein [Spartinivicinus ruber]|uniref:hypothetical protein n=1 Tax=Spartinivicinus ruber TaxID=2683272 RepID=UPI0013D2F6FA|nr:hypothetical protein [Spartinivicinus ruber]
MKNKLILIFFIILSPHILAKPEVVSLYTYHNHPPFINGIDDGLTYDLVNLLNIESKGKYLFTLKVLPRKRLDKKIVNDGSWTVVWANPEWFNDHYKTKYRWLSILEDASTVISRVEDSIEYKGPQSLKGLTFGAMAGHKYLGIDELVRKGEIKRILIIIIPKLYLVAYLVVEVFSVLQMLA